jgi:hypothetical protein
MLYRYVQTFREVRYWRHQTDQPGRSDNVCCEGQTGSGAKGRIR